MRSKSYLRHVRGGSCLRCRSPYPSAHHLQRVGEKGMALKSGDEWAVPLCHRCHTDLHQGGNSEDLWWALLGIDAKEWAVKSYREWLDGEGKDD